MAVPQKISLRSVRGKASSAGFACWPGRAPIGAHARQLRAVVIAQNLPLAARRSGAAELRGLREGKTGPIGDRGGCWRMGIGDGG